MQNHTKQQDKIVQLTPWYIWTLKKPSEMVIYKYNRIDLTLKGKTELIINMKVRFKMNNWILKARSKILLTDDSPKKVFQGKNWR